MKKMKMGTDGVQIKKDNIQYIAKALSKKKIASTSKEQQIITIPKEYESTYRAILKTFNQRQIILYLYRTNTNTTTTTTTTTTLSKTR